LRRCDDAGAEMRASKKFVKILGDLRNFKKIGKFEYKPPIASFANINCVE
jgi:hypothetical protein